MSRASLLDDPLNYPSIRSANLGGSHFNEVFSDYPGLVREPLRVSIGEKTGAFHVHMNYCEYSKEDTALLRVLVETETARHSSLVLIDHEDNAAYWFEPFESPLDRQVHALIERYLNMPVIRLRVRAPEGIEEGEADYCEAYAIKFAHDYINGNEFNLNNMRSFANRIEKEHPRGSRVTDPYYGWEQVVGTDFTQANGLFDDPRVRAAVIGGGLGALGGGLIGGGQGLLIGGLGGALGGYALSGPGGIF